MLHGIKDSRVIICLPSSGFPSKIRNDHGSLNTSACKGESVQRHSLLIKGITGRSRLFLRRPGLTSTKSPFPLAGVGDWGSTESPSLLPFQRNSVPRSTHKSKLPDGSMTPPFWWLPRMISLQYGLPDGDPTPLQSLQTVLDQTSRRIVVPSTNPGEHPYTQVRPPVMCFAEKHARIQVPSKLS